MTIAKAKKGKPYQIAIVKATALAALGRCDEAIAALSQPDIKDQLRAEIFRSQVLADMGRCDEAISLLKAALEKHPDSIPAHFYLAAIGEQVGDGNTARKHYEWIHDTYWDQWQGQGAKDFDDAEQATLMGRAFDRWAVLNMKYATDVNLHKQILKVFVQAYDVIDRNYWPAHVAAAEYFMSHGNTPEAGKELKAALAGNPNDAQSHMLAGLIALETWNFDAADAQIAAIRKVDDQSPDGDILETRALLQQRRPADAIGPIKRLLARQPKNLEALGLLASCHALLLQEDKVQETLKQVEALDPNNASAYLDLAEQLGGMRQYPRAEAMYEKAIKRAPWLSSATTDWGCCSRRAAMRTRRRRSSTTPTPWTRSTIARPTT